MKKALLGLAGVAALTSGAQAEPAKLTTDAGVLAGTMIDGVRVFKGVPYAKPPVGDLRWRPPQPTSWSGERDATEFQLPCAQATPSDGSPNLGGVSGSTSEDCLYLNVWVPKDAKDAPVMVWLYGGAGYLGAGSVPTYDGSAFARDGVIVVTINYRLGMLGQFAHPALTKAAGQNEPLANFQLMDAVAALQWVQRNSVALGADARNVTIFGQSAGAVLVAALLSTPPSQGLFHKAIIQSAVPQLGGRRSLTQAEADGVKFANVLGLAGADATPEQLRSLPLDRVISSEARGDGFKNGSYLILDGRFRTTTTGDGFKTGLTADVPLIVGSTNGEFFGPEGYRMAQAASNYGEAPVWHYHFTYVPAWRATEQSGGAPHSAELPYVFNTLRQSAIGSRATAADQSVADRLHSCWVAFAKAPSGTRSLSCEGGFVWPARTDESDAIAVFGEKFAIARAKPLIDANATAFPLPPGVGEPAN